MIVEQEYENPRAWLKDLCRKDHPLLGSPFLHDHDGKTYECATNGHGLILMLGAGVTTRRDGPPIDPFLAPPPVLLGRAGIDDLIEWGGQVECGCGFCDPAGANEYRHPIKVPFRLGRLFGRLIDRWYVYQFLEYLSPHQEYVEVRSEADPLAPIQFLGDGWIVVIMPCRDNGDGDGMLRTLEPFPRPSDAHRAALEVLEGGA